ncbi:MAG: phosphoribosylformylglycinamidine synthase [Lachnospiraceae bacterium]|nr:phosphoribosylformylglycinamidine synthase [Lachnospiraceae bacterium]
MVNRFYSEKKEAFNIKGKELQDELREYLGITFDKVRILVRYDVEGVSNDTLERAKNIVFSEPPVDNLYVQSFPSETNDHIFSIEYLPGQFDQRADSACQCIMLLNPAEKPEIKTAVTYCLTGTATCEEINTVKSYLLNPVDSRIANEAVPETVVMKYDEPEDVKILDTFTSLEDKELHELYDSLNLAMTFADFCFIKQYFLKEDREPSITEIRVLDTYWSDHCRHTTFQTEITNIEIEKGDFKTPIEETLNLYKETRETLYANRTDKPVTLMDLALVAMKALKKSGKLNDLEESDEINACSIIVPVEIDGKTEDWLVFFKNETHNHPTEIEPFGGAATCLGGAIRDPLSGRGYVYQAMRVTGAADPTLPINETTKGKLPQRKLTTGAAKGYSSYGNQIGLSTGLVDEIYHPNYLAKRLEIGAVMGAAKKENVMRLTSDPGDVIVLIGGRTGRDGCGGATGSSKAHNTESIHTCGAEVQKGNAPTERKIQRLFRNPEVSKLIKKCNDFGAGGVSVAIGELADGLEINLDLVPKKYAGLDGTELAISESQERMALVVDPKDLDAILKYSEEENLEAIKVATVTENPRLVMYWRGKKIVDLSRAFLDTNGAHQETCAVIKTNSLKDSYFKKGRDYISSHTNRKLERGNKTFDDTFASKMEKMLSDLNVCSKRGLVEMFDSSIGASTLVMPFGGKLQATPIQTMVAHLPVENKECETVTMMSYGFDPFLSEWCPYHGSIYAVISSIAKIAAAGGDYTKIHFTFQEYFKKLGNNPANWGEPLLALLGAFKAQMEFGLASIGGKDSMSGSFGEINVPPTLVSFAVSVDEAKNMITPELKAAGNCLLLFPLVRDNYELPNFKKYINMLDAIKKASKLGLIKSMYAVGSHGIAESAFKMATGSDLGVKFDNGISQNELFLPNYGSILAEVEKADLDKIYAIYNEAKLIGEVTEANSICFKNDIVSLSFCRMAFEEPLEKVFPTKAKSKTETPLACNLYDAKNIFISNENGKKPTVFMPIFPGTNCEYDLARTFIQNGAKVNPIVFKNQTESQITETIYEYEKAIKEAQIIMFSGGFSAGDEPDGSGKFIASAFRNELLKTAVNDLLKTRDGLILGICNGFQALIKLGLVPYGEICDLSQDSPTLTHNAIGKHVSRMVHTKVVSNNSPWLSKCELGKVYTIPSSHGEGRFVANNEWLAKLAANGQIATQYVDLAGNPTFDDTFNPNGSFMAIEGILSADLRVLGKMAHSERTGKDVAINIPGEHYQPIIAGGVSYFL